MNSAATQGPQVRWSSETAAARVRKRYAAERRFRLLGLLAVASSALFLAFLLTTMAWRGLSGFTQTEAAVPIDFARSDVILDPAALRDSQSRQVLAGADLEGLISTSAMAVYGPAAERMFGAAAVRALGDKLIDDPQLLQRRDTLWLPVSGAIDVAAKGNGAEEAERLVESLEAENRLRRGFNAGFLSNSDATDATVVGVWGALKGSLLTIFVTMLLAFPI